MSDFQVTLVAGTYDRPHPLRDGCAKPDGCSLTYLAMKPMGLFFL